MCGLTGIFKFPHPLHDTDLHALPLMTDRLQHRGPDAGAQWSDGHVGLGHRRLSILDLSPDGFQPMHSNNERYVIAYNGEVYNFEELRRSLEAEGVSFNSSGDTQVILEAFAHWGIERTLPLLNGMFAIALWDRRDRRLTLMRDAAGIKPLFWARIPGGVVFGSEIKALRAHDAFNKALCEDALGDYFNRTYIAAPRTIYQDCYRLKSGEIISIDMTGDIKSSFYQPKRDYKYFTADLQGPALLDAFEAEMKRAVAAHMRADVPVAAFLSGGNDSALVTALAVGTRNFKTYSIGYHEPAYDESARAQQIATHYGLPHEIFMLGPQDVLSPLSRLHDFYDEPFADASALPTHIISKHVVKDAKVALSGDGADELFAGYPRYRAGINEWNRMAVIPLSLRPFIAKLIPDAPDKLIYPLSSLVLSDPARVMPYIKSMLSEPSMLTAFQSMNYIGINHDLSRNVDMMGVTRRDVEKMSVAGDPLRSLLSYDQAIRLPEGMLTKVDRASMAASLEVRVPFLDSNIIGISKALPSALLSPAGGGTKKIIKDVLLRHLPAEIVNSPKTGFHVPMKIWLREHFSDWAQDLLSGDDPYIDMQGARVLWQQYAQGKNDLFYGLWCVLMYRQWRCAQ